MTVNAAARVLLDAGGGTHTSSSFLFYFYRGKTTLEIKLSVVQWESYIQFKGTLVLGDVSFSKKDLKFFVHFLLKCLPGITQEDVHSVRFWGKVGKCSFTEQVRGNFKVRRAYPLFDAIVKLVKEKGDVTMGAGVAWLGQKLGPRFSPVVLLLPPQP